MRIIAAFGQSNISGRDSVVEMRSGVPANRKRLWKFTAANTWDACREPVDGPSGSLYPILDDMNAGVSPASSMLDTIAVEFPNEHFGVSISAKGGTEISQWSPNSDPKSLYGASLSRTRAAIGTGNTLSAIVWYQGETDAALGKQWYWEGKFLQLVHFWRYNFSNPDLPVIIVGIGDVGPNVLNIDKNNWRELQDIQANISAHNVVAVSAAGLPLMDDQQHLTSSGAIALGERIGRAVIPFLRR